MEHSVLDEVMSGTDESCLWVTLGFSPELEENDVVHIVCATTVDAVVRDSGVAELYMDRFDQRTAAMVVPTLSW